MADTPIGAGSVLVTHPQAIPPAPAVMAILNRFNREELGNTIEVLVALLDIWEGDPDNEPNGDDEAREADGDTLDSAYIEWHTKHGNQRRNGQPEILASDNEDDEEDDPAGQYDEDCYTGPQPRDEGVGCPIADPGGCEHDGREEECDAELEQMGDDVPMLPVVSAEHNIFNDQRTPLGISNLQSSFVGEVRSADTGALHKGLAPTRISPPGVPV